MADNTAKIILEASVDGVLRAAETVKKKFVDVGNEGGKAGEKMLVGLGKSLLTTAALVAAVKGVAEAMNTAAAAAAKLSKESGGRQLSSEIAGQRLGMSAVQTSSVLNATGPRSLDERSSFLTALAGAKGVGGRSIDSATAIQASRVFNSGVIGQDEILSAISSRGRRGLDALENKSHQRIAGLSDTARQELYVREDEAAAGLRIDETAGPEGQQERRRLAEMEALRAEHRAAFSVVDAIGAATSKVGGKQLIEAGQRVLHNIAENTRPRLNTSANGP